MWISAAAVIALLLAGLAASGRREPESDATGPDVGNPDGSAAGSGGSIASEPEGLGWVLNPEMPYLITVQGLSERQASALRRLLEQGPGADPVAHRQAIFEIVSRRTFVWKELESFLEQTRPEFERAFEEHRSRNAGYAVAPEVARAGLEDVLRADAASSLGAQPQCDVAALMDDAAHVAPSVSTLMGRYGYATLDRYLRHVDRHLRVKSVPPDHADSQDYDLLIEAGLARRGSEIPTHCILDFMDMDQLVRTTHRLGGPDSRNRTELIRFLETSDGLHGALAGFVAGGCYYQLLPLRREGGDAPEVDPFDIARSWRFTNQLITALTLTWSSAEANSNLLARAAGSSQEILGWEVEPARSSRCPFARTQATLRHPPGDPPLVPLHVGCTCRLRPVVAP